MRFLRRMEGWNVRLIRRMEGPRSDAMISSKMVVTDAESEVRGDGGKKFTTCLDGTASAASAATRDIMEGSPAVRVVARHELGRTAVRRPIIDAGRTEIRPRTGDILWSADSMALFTCW